MMVLAKLNPKYTSTHTGKKKKKNQQRGLSMSSILFSPMLATQTKSARGKEKQIRQGFAIP